MHLSRTEIFVKERELALRSYEEQRLLALEAARLGTWELDVADGVVHVDERGRELLSLDQPSASIEAAMARVHPDDRPLVERAMTRALHPGSDGRYDVEYRVLPAPVRAPASAAPALAPEERWVHATGRALFQDQVGACDAARLVAVIADRSEARRAAAQAARLAAIVDQCDDAIIRQLRDGTITDWNAAAERIFGHRAGEAVGRSIDIIAPPERPDEPLQLIQRCWQGEDIRGFETVRVTRDGRRLDVAVTMSAIRSAGGEVIAVSTIDRDITAQKRQAEALRAAQELRERHLVELDAVLDQMTEGVVVFDPGGNLVHMNPAALAIHGFEDLTELRLHLDQLPAFFELFDLDGQRLSTERWPIGRVLRGETFSAYEVRVRRRDTGKTWIGSYGGILVRDRAGQPLRAVVTLRDVTERQEAERALQDARKAAEAASRAKSEFLANMSHELRTPMTAILGYADLLGQRLHDAEALQHLETIRRNGHFLLELLNDILDLSRIEAGRMEIERERFRPDALLAEVCSLMAVRAQAKQIALAMEIESELPQTIESDPTRLRQILINLIGNAIKFTEHGSVRVVTCLLAEREALRIAVIDTGIGMSVAQQQRLFQAFSQGDSTVARRYGGSGLGLIISRRLIAMLGGEIRVESALDQGSTFEITVPTGALAGVPRIRPEQARLLSPAVATAAPDTAANAVLRATARMASPEPAAVLSAEAAARLTCRVLVVDDQDDVRNLVRYELARAGAAVSSVSDGQQALDLVLQAERSGAAIDVVLLDMQMPLLDGYDTARKLRAAGFQGAIVALTASAMQGDRERCLEAGCDDYASKPLDVRRLVELVSGLAQPAPAPPSRQRAGCSVLVVDDNPDVREALQMLLELRGHTVTTAGSGSAALEISAAQQPDVVVLDLGLPDISGLEVATQIRSNPALGSTVLIALSGRDQPEDVKRSRAAGFDHHLVKPARTEALERLFPRRDPQPRPA
jgi:PAS domain S-box-containing protein